MGSGFTYTVQINQIQVSYMKLYSYWRSTAAYRVRIALALKGIDYEYIPVNLVKDGGEQHSPDYRAKNPQGLVPLLEHKGRRINQSLSIIRYLESIEPTPTLYADDPLLNARIESFALSICADIHPLNNLRVLNYLTTELAHTPEEKHSWYHHWLKHGFDSLEGTLSESETEYCLTDYPSVADICLVAQVYNARRFNFSLDAYPNIAVKEQHCLMHSAFAMAIPEKQLDAE